MPDSPTTPKRGRPPAASREDVLAAAMQRYLRGQRVDVRAIAAELGLGRATVYRWFGGRDNLMGEVLAGAADPLLDVARAEARGRGGRALLDTFDRFNRGIIGAPALRQYVEQEREAALRVITSGAGVVEPHLVGRIAELIEEQVRRGAYEPPVEPVDPRLRDRASRRGLPVQRRRRGDPRRRRPAARRRGGAPRRQQPPTPPTSGFCSSRPAFERNA